MRKAVCMFFAQADQTEQIRHLLFSFCPMGIQAIDRKRLGDNIGNRHARIQRRIRVLKDHLHFFSQFMHFTRTGGKHIGAFKQDAAAGGFIEPEHRTPGGRLPTAGFADQPHRFALMNGKGKSVHGLQIAFADTKIFL